MYGTVMDIQRFCLQDGPGIRTTVFLKGCNIHCMWCHNPESMSKSPQLMFSSSKCILCKKCQSVCPQGAHLIINGVHNFKRELCIACGKCVANCFTGALSICGKNMTCAEVMDELNKDSIYYRSSGGGITFSGGEPTLQFDFLFEVLRKCKQKGYHTALETNGLVNEENLKKLLKYIDLFLLDYKLEKEQFFRWTGGDFNKYEKTLKVLNEEHSRIILRCPIIPGINDTDVHFRSINLLKEKYHVIEKVQIMPYHDTGKEKWKECGKDYQLSNLRTVSERQKEIWQHRVD